MRRTIRVGGPPEHFNYPWRKAISDGLFASRGLDVAWKDMPAGTGAMVEALKSDDIDIALALTEGIEAAIARGDGLDVVGTWVESSLTWGVHASYGSPLTSFSDLQDARFAISRFGSGSHLMPLVEARRRGWDERALRFVVVGGIEGARAALAAGEADVFLWEKYTTRPRVHAGEWICFDEVAPPWPAFVAAVRAGASLPIDALFEVLRPICDTLSQNLDGSVEEIATFYDLDRDDVRAWLGEVRWAATSTLDEAARQRARDALGL